MARGLSLSIAFISFLLILLGGVVHNTESSLACPDWPLCFGQIMPEMKGGVLIEHSHRMLATFVGFLTTLLLIVSYRKREDNQQLFHFSILAFILVVFQGLLGGITVIYKLPTIVSTTHLGTALVFISLAVLLHHIQEKTQEVYEADINYPPILKHLIVAGGIFLFYQILLGAFLRHSGSGAACGLGFENSLLCLDTTTGSSSFLPSLPTAKVNILHRMMGILLGVYTLFLSFKFKKTLKQSTNKNIKKVGSLLFGLSHIILSQIVLGILTVAYNIRPIPTTLHLGGAALSLIFYVKIYLILRSQEQEAFKLQRPSFISDIVELFKPRLSLLVMVTTLIGLLMAPTHVNFFRAIFILASILMVIMGAASLNCYIERDVDAKMDRTKDRALASKRISPEFGLRLGISLLVVSIISLYILTNFLTIGLAILATVSYLLAYTPLKRKTSFAVVVGALPGALPPLMGWTSIENSISPIAWMVFAIMCIWQIPHFMAISIYLGDDYKNADILVFPNTSGLGLTKIYIFILTIILALVSIVPYYISYSTKVYLIVAIVLGTIFTIISSIGFFKKTQDDIKLWGKRYFWASIIYLPILLAALMFFK